MLVEERLLQSQDPVPLRHGQLLLWRCYCGDVQGIVDAWLVLQLQKLQQPVCQHTHKE